MALVPEKKDPNARVRSLERAQACVNAYDWLLRAVPNPEETMAFANRMALRKLLKEWQGAWSEYQDFTDRIVPFETQYVRHRNHFQSLGIDLKLAPILIQQDNKMLPVQYVAEKKKEENPSKEGINIGPLLGIGAAIVAGMMILGGRKQLSGGFSGTEEQHRKLVMDQIPRMERWLQRISVERPGSGRMFGLLQELNSDLRLAQKDAAWLDFKDPARQRLDNIMTRFIRVQNEYAKERWKL